LTFGVFRSLLRVIIMTVFTQFKKQVLPALTTLDWREAADSMWPKH
jgi:hypothetical protein